jgi:hypothetical protein
MKIKQNEYEFTNVYCLKVDIENKRLIACMYDEDFNLVVNSL